MNPLTDQKISKKYRIIAELGKGGMAEVLLCVAQGPIGFNKLQVIKRLKGEVVKKPEFVAMFLDEARLAAKLNHPNVVQTNEVGQDDEDYFIAMEYLEGQSVASIVRAYYERHRALLPINMYLYIVQEALRGLQYVHELADFDGTRLNIVHRDVNPQNIFVLYSGGVKVLDFGIAKAVTSSTDTQTGVLKGKISYMAPEQVLSGAVDRRADIFAVGVMIWSAITGQLPWEGETDVKKLLRVCAGEVPAPRSLKPDCHPDIDRICRKALAFRPEDRYASAEELRQELELYTDKHGRVTSSEVVKMMSDLFDAERQNVRRAIEQHLAKLKEEPAKDHTAIMLASRPPGPPAPGRLGTGGQTALVAELGSVSAATPAQGGRGRVVAAGIALAAIAAAGIGFARMNGAKTAVAQAASSAVASPPPPTAQAPAAPAVVDLAVRVTPGSARILLDDQLLDKNPYQGKVPRDGVTHKLRIEADGYVPETRTVSFDRDMTFDVELAKVSTPVAARPAPAPHAPAAAPPHKPDAPAAAPAQPSPGKSRPALDKVDL